jgi:hypothetical protein
MERPYGFVLIFIGIVIEINGFKFNIENFNFVKNFDIFCFCTKLAEKKRTKIEQFLVWKISKD